MEDVTFWLADVLRAGKYYLHKRLLSSNFFSPQIMKKRFRVKSNEEFQAIITKGKRLAGKGFVIYYAKSAMVTNDRVGISVGKKIGCAVERNKIKRQVRMMVDELVDFHKGIDTVVIVRSSYLDRDFETNKKELSKMYESVYNKVVDEL